MIFDLARVESTFPDGRRNWLDYHGAAVYSLVPDFTSDIGHLNEWGRRVAARELLQSLARALRTRVSMQAGAGGHR